MDIKIPDIAKGKVIPEGMIELKMKEEKERQLKKREHKHNYLVALTGTVGGGIMGLLTSFLYNLFTK